MDIMLQTYLEETEELLQSAEECIIRLEIEYSPQEINELFRIVHTLKGSSQMMGYDDIGDLLHKMEDMLDLARGGLLEFDEALIGNCFDGLDTVSRMLEWKKEPTSDSEMVHLQNLASEISQRVDELIRLNKKDEEKSDEDKRETHLELGFVSSLLNKGKYNKETQGKNKFYATFVIEEEAPMISPVLMMILQTVDEIGSLLYSSVSDEFFNAQSPDENLRELEIIFTTDFEGRELSKHLEIFYVESIKITDLGQSEPRGKAQDKVLNDALDSTQILGLNEALDRAQNEGLNETLDNVRSEGRAKGQREILALIEKAQVFLREKELIRTFKPEGKDYISTLRKYSKELPDSTLLLGLDLRDLPLVCEKELRELISLKRELEEKLELVILVDGPQARRVVNIFDAIKKVAEFKVYKNEGEALLDTLNLREFFGKLGIG